MYSLQVALPIGFYGIIDEDNITTYDYAITTFRGKERLRSPSGPDRLLIVEACLAGAEEDQRYRRGGNGGPQGATHLRQGAPRC